MRFPFMVLAAALLAACTGPSTVTSSSENVAVEYSGDQMAEAEAKARAHCSDYRKRARLRSVSTQADGQRIAIYDCVSAF